MKSAIVTLCLMFIGALSCFAEITPDQQSAALSKKLDAIIIPTVELREAKVNDVVQFLVAVGKQNDPDKIGVNIILMDKENKSTITLALKKISLHKVVKLVAEMAGTSLDLEDGVVVLRKPKDKK